MAKSEEITAENAPGRDSKEQNKAIDGTFEIGSTAKSHESSFGASHKSLPETFSTVTTAGNDFKLPAKSFLGIHQKIFHQHFWQSRPSDGFYGFSCLFMGFSP